MQMKMEIPDELAINCTNLRNTSDIFGKVLLTATKLSDPSISNKKKKTWPPIELSLQILEQFEGPKKGSSKLSPLQKLHSMFSDKESAPRRMMYEQLV
jgi:cell division control protein 6